MCDMQCLLSKAAKAMTSRKCIQRTQRDMHIHVQMTSWARGLGVASLVGSDVTRVKEQPDFYLAKLNGK